MESHDESEDIPLPLRGKTVTRCIIDRALGIDFIDEGERSTIRIERRFLLRRVGPDKSFTIGKVEETAKALHLIGKTVAKATARSDGALGVTFEDGTVLSVPPDPSSVAWEFAGPDRSGIVSLPGGGLSTWMVEVQSAKTRGKP